MPTLNREVIVAALWPTGVDIRTFETAQTYMRLGKPPASDGTPNSPDYSIITTYIDNGTTTIAHVDCFLQIMYTPETLIVNAGVSGHDFKPIRSKQQFIDEVAYSRMLAEKNGQPYTIVASRANNIDDYALSIARAQAGKNGLESLADQTDSLSNMHMLEFVKARETALFEQAEKLHDAARNTMSLWERFTTGCAALPCSISFRPNQECPPIRLNKPNGKRQLLIYDAAEEKYVPRTQTPTIKPIIGGMIIIEQKAGNKSIQFVH